MEHVIFVAKLAKENGLAFLPALDRRQLLEAGQLDFFARLLEKAK